MKFIDIYMDGDFIGILAAVLWQGSILLSDLCPGRGDSHMEQTGMLVVSLGFWSRLGCSGQSANILSLQGLVYGSAKKHRITLTTLPLWL